MEVVHFFFGEINMWLQLYMLLLLVNSKQLKPSIKRHIYNDVLLVTNYHYTIVISTYLLIIIGTSLSLYSFDAMEPLDTATRKKHIITMTECEWLIITEVSLVIDF